MTADEQEAVRGFEMAAASVENAAAVMLVGYLPPAEFRDVLRRLHEAVVTARALLEDSTPRAIAEQACDEAPTEEEWDSSLDELRERAQRLMETMPKGPNSSRRTMRRWRREGLLS